MKDKGCERKRNEGRTERKGVCREGRGEGIERGKDEGNEGIKGVRRETK